MKNFEEFLSEIDKAQIAQTIYDARSKLSPALEEKGYTGYKLEQALATPMAITAAETMLEAYHNWLVPQIDSTK